MKKSHSQPGSALLILLLLMTVLTLVVQQRLRTGTFSYDVAMMRAQSCKQQWAQTALLNYGIAWCKAQKHNLLAAPLDKKYELQVKWTTNHSEDTVGLVTIQKKNEGVFMNARLKHSTQSSDPQSCLIELSSMSMRIKKMN